jgi:hypothetical protein
VRRAGGETPPPAREPTLLQSIITEKGNSVESFREKIVRKVKIYSENTEVPPLKNKKIRRPVQTPQKYAKG